MVVFLHHEINGEQRNSQGARGTHQVPFKMIICSFEPDPHNKNGTFPGSKTNCSFLPATFYICIFLPSSLVSIFQRMLALALEADRCPTVQSAKLSQELFLMLISSSFGRVHRWVGSTFTIHFSVLDSSLMSALFFFTTSLDTPGRPCFLLC